MPFHYIHTWQAAFCLTETRKVPEGNSRQGVPTRTRVFPLSGLDWPWALNALHFI